MYWSIPLLVVLLFLYAYFKESPEERKILIKTPPPIPAKPLMEKVVEEVIKPSIVKKKISNRLPRKHLFIIKTILTPYQ
jgi:hypothetical protein